MFKKSNFLAHLLLLSCIALVILTISNLYFGGYMGNANQMALELWASPDNLEEWQLSSTAPYKYRVLFSSIVKSTYLLTSKVFPYINFHLVYVLVSYFSLLFATVSFYLLASQVNDMPYFAFTACMIFLLSPAIIFSHSVPVHTREDFLAYGLLSLGIFFLIRGEYKKYLLVSVIAVLCRETLLILPFLMFFFFNQNLNLLDKLLMALAPVGVYIILRLGLYEASVYETFMGFEWNIENPLQALFFVYFTFHSLWSIYLYRLFVMKSIQLSYPINQLSSSSIWAILLIFLSSLLMGILNEIRLMFLAFPWLILLSLDFIFSSKTVLLKSIKSKQSMGILGFCLLMMLIGILIIFYFQTEIKSNRYHNDSIIPLMVGGLILTTFNIWVLVVIKNINQIGAIENE